MIYKIVLAVIIITGIIVSFNPIEKELPHLAEETVNGIGYKEKVELYYDLDFPNTAYEKLEDGTYKEVKING